MLLNNEIILEGSYLYYQDNIQYAEENFKLVKDKGHQHFTFHSEILSRLKTGEFLKIFVKYEINQYFIPLQVRTERSVGDQYAIETYKLDPTTMELNYSFNALGVNQEFRKNLSSRQHIPSPAVCTSGLFTLTKKFENKSRVGINFLSSENDWNYLGPPSEKTIYAEHKMGETNELVINGNNINSTRLKLYSSDSTQSHTADEVPVELFLSKHFGVPYQLIQGEQKIIVKFLQRNDD